MDIQKSLSGSISSIEKPTDSVQWRGVTLFITLTFALSWALFLGMSAANVPFAIRFVPGLFGPALAALLTRLIRHEGFADAGLRLRATGQKGVGKLYLAAYFIPPVLIALSIGVAMLTGYQHWALGDNLQMLAQLMKQQAVPLPHGMTYTQMATNSLVQQGIAVVTISLLTGMILAFGEEFGWRGYLLPHLAPLGGIRAAVLVGVIWGLWHAPIILLGYNYPGHPLGGILIMVLFDIALSMIFTWLRLRSGSIWPSTLAHAAFNAQSSFALIFLSATDVLLRAPIGLIGLILWLIFAFFLASTGRLDIGSKTTNLNQNHTYLTKIAKTER